MLKISIYINIFLIIAIVCLIAFLVVFSNRFAQMQQMLELAMTSHIYIHEMAERANEVNSVKNSKEWIQHMYNRKDQLNLNNQTWENYFDYAASKNIILAEEQ